VDIEETMRQATEELRQQQARLRELREKARESSTTVRSADGMITVVVDGRGELSSIALNNAKWRRMPPAELCAALVKTISKARQESQEELLSAYGPLLPKGRGLPRSQDGRVNLDEMFDDAVRRGTELLAGERPGAGLRRSLSDQEGKSS
jgi:DNA-binding protein YbaB